MKVADGIAAGLYSLEQGQVSTYKGFRLVIRKEVQRTTPLY